jgi:hypothetical protein
MFRAVDLDVLSRAGAEVQIHALLSGDRFTGERQRIVSSILHRERIENCADGLDAADVVMPRNPRHHDVARC